MFVRAYLRASTKEQDASRARADLEEFAEKQGLTIASYYVENESGASLKRPELFRLLSDCQKGDILLVEQVDRLSRLNASDWDYLRQEISNRGVRVVALDLPTSHMLTNENDDEMTTRMMGAINGMMLDMLAAIARKDFTDRRRRQAQGIAKAKAKGKYRGRPVDRERHQNIRDMIDKGHSWTEIGRFIGVSRSTIARAVKGA
ncbi:recombinase family protein [Marinobacter lacisalsi]|uniref:Recombinase family protein n=1 Tax=Marinobacter lacisalsi TaxID=475979 RepID=A0ABV8QGG5_9GAMM